MSETEKGTPGDAGRKVEGVDDDELDLAAETVEDLEADDANVRGGQPGRVTSGFTCGGGACE